MNTSRNRIGGRLATAAFASLTAISLLLLPHPARAGAAGSLAASLGVGCLSSPAGQTLLLTADASVFAGTTIQRVTISVDGLPAQLDSGAISQTHFRQSVHVPATVGSHTIVMRVETNNLPVVERDGTATIGAHSCTVVSAYCPAMRADIDGDGLVSVLDLAQVAAHFLEPVTLANAVYNQDSDGSVTILDVAIVASHFLDKVTACPEATILQTVRAALPT